MKSNVIVTRLAVLALAAFTLGSTAMAGPGPMYMMMHGKMYVVTPMAKDMMCKNGCKVGMDGMVTMPKSKPAMLKDGDMVTSDGVRMSATHKGRGE